jgi:hypothetical protein
MRERTVARVLRSGVGVLCLLLLAARLSAQDLDPRAYANVPVNGTLLRTQAPMGAFQTHLSYSFRRQLWAAFNATYYVGGRTTIKGVDNHDQQSNSRVGPTLVLPVGRRHSVTLAASRGAIIRYGADFSTFSIGWQTGRIPRSKPAR